jgi:hypothetical protein
MVARQNTGVPYLPLGKPAGKYLLSKISKSGQGQHSRYSVGTTALVYYLINSSLQYIQVLYNRWWSKLNWLDGHQGYSQLSTNYVFMFHVCQVNHGQN